MSQNANQAKPTPRLVVDAGRVQQGSAAAVAKPAAPPVKPQTDAMGVFVGLEMEARQCRDVESLRFAIVNSTRRLAGFDEAYLVEPKAAGGWSLVAASGVHAVDRHAPLIRFMEAWTAKTIEAERGALGEPKFYNLPSDAVRYGLDAADIAMPYAFWLPLRKQNGELLAALVAVKKEPWRPQVVSMLIPLAGAYAHAWQALVPAVVSPTRHVYRAITKSRLAIAIALLMTAAGFIPVPMSALAPAEVVAREARLVTAPIDGVISDILVSPGAMVAKGTPLVTFADIDLRNTHELAKRNKAVAQAKYFKAIQTATSAQKDVADVAIAKAELDVAVSDLAYAEEMLARTVVKAQSAGLVIYSSKSDWIGKPVKTGERIMEIGNPDRTELKIEVPVSDAITLREGGSVALFLDGDPLTAIQGKISHANYRPAPNSETTLVYKVHASFEDGQPRRIGLRGVARVSSHDVSLAFYLFRRPIAALRQRFGI
jgi:multidrug efflux pump subunit AcrA (membrane-fusion protein)